jgi:hypothetical protein
MVWETVQVTVHIPSEELPEVKVATIRSVAARLALSIKKVTLPGLVAV